MRVTECPISILERRPRTGSRGFTIVELVVVIGVVMILISMIVAPLGQSMERSRMVRDGAQLRQNMAVLGLYSNDYQDMYPIGHATAFRSARYWHHAAVAGGYLRSSAEADPAAQKRYGVITLHMSMSLAADPDDMLPGRSLPAGVIKSVPVRHHDVLYPSDKGAMVKFYSEGGPHPQRDAVGRWFCCGDPWTVPAAMCDGSVTFSDYYAYTGGVYPLVIDGVGVPIWSTWGGCSGRDR